MPMSRNILDAVHTLGTLRIGDRVELSEDGRTHIMSVSRTIRRSDGQFGSIESSHVTVTFGPGRYSTEIRAERLASGAQTLRVLA